MNRPFAALVCAIAVAMLAASCGGGGSDAPAEKLTIVGAGS